MPIQTDAPIGLGSPEDWWFEGATSKIVAVRTFDGDSSFIYADSGGAVKTILFTFPTLAGMADPVNSAVLVAWPRIYKLGGSPTSGQVFRFFWNSAAAANVFTSLPINKTYVYVAHTVAAPTLAAVNGSHGLSVTGTNGPNNKFEVWCSQFYRQVDFSYPAPGGGGVTDGGGFTHLVGGLIGAIGASLLLRDMPALARAIWRRTGTLIKPCEYEMALREWRAEKHVRVAG